MKITRFAILGLVVALALAFSGGSAVQAQTTSHTYSTTIQVQNLTASTATISMVFYPEGSGTGTAPFSDSVAANGQKSYGTLPSTVAAGFNGGAVISSNQKIAAIVNVTGDGLKFGLSSYSGFTSGSTSVGLPLLFKSTYGFSTFFNVQNVGTASATNVRIVYKGKTTAGATVNLSSGPFTIPLNSTKRFDQTQEAALPAGFFGSATVTSDQPVVATVVQVGPTTMLGYNGFTAGGTTNPIFPLINANSYNFITGIALLNLGSAPTTVTISYTPTNSSLGTACTETQTIPAGSSVNFAIDAFSKTVAGENCVNGRQFVGTGKVTANSANAQLVGIVNQLNQVTNKGDSYAAVNATQATNTVVFPLAQGRVYGYFTGITLVNVGSVATPVRCTFSNSTVVQQTASLAAGLSVNFVQNDVFSSLYNGSAVCTATATNAKIVGIANVLNSSTTIDSFSTYNGINN